jgi:(S)-2-hydroxyglutarate dehydrogenase
MAQHQVDFAIIGGGIVGLATAYQISNHYRDATIALLEKENQVAAHQSGRNSGVLHSGIYYKPGSLKAINCREGKLLMEAFCQEHSIRYETCGKVIVALDEKELPLLQRIYERGQGNAVKCEKIDQKQLKELEPHAAGIAGIHVREAGIVDYPGVCRRLADLLRERGHQVWLNAEVVGIKQQAEQVELSTRKETLQARYVVNCGGLQSDRLIRMSGDTPPAKIVPFRGEYYQLKPQYGYLCKNLIYPVPDPEFPFLGVHFTRMVDSSVECGPNAVLALAREGYNWLTVNPKDLLESLSYSGFLKMARKHWSKGLGEVQRSLSKGAFVRALQRLVPELREEFLIPCRAGVRAQAVTADGALVDDFLFLRKERIIHVCNAPSPAATASLKIGETILAELQQIVLPDQN